MSTPANDHSVFPLYLDATALHGLAGDIVRTIAPHSEVDPAALLSQPPEACGSVISLSPSMLVGTGRHQLPTQPLLPPADHYRLRRVGDMWDLHYRNKQMWVKNCRGVQLLDYLLHSPHRDCHALELTQLVTRGNVVGDLTSRNGLPEQRLVQEGLSIAHGNAANAGLDARARTEYQNRLRDLEEEIKEAEAYHDLGRLEQLQMEKQAFLEQITGDGYRGRKRQESPEIRGPRTNIQKRLKDVRAKIRREDPKLGEHLDKYISTGTWCSYRPPLDTPPWE